MSVSPIGLRNTASPLYATSVAGASDASAPDTTNRTSSARSQFRGDFASLLDAVKAGDMTSAQQALTAVQSDLASSNATYSTQSGSTSGQLPGDIQSLFSAVQSGDAAGAQGALTKLQSDAAQNAPARGAQGHHHHHHHHQDAGGANDTTPTSSSDPLTAPAATTSDSTSGS